MANRFQTPDEQFGDSTGAPYAGGSLYFYVTGTDTPANTYSDSTLVTANANPVALDSAGRAGDVFLDPAVTYKVVLKDAAGVEVWTHDPVKDPAAGVSAAFQVYNGDPNGNVSGTAGAIGGSSASSIYDITNGVLWICTTTGDAASTVWTQVGAVLSGAVRITGVLTPSTLAADQDDYAPTDIATASTLRLAASSAVSITGIAGGEAGRALYLFNIGSYAITLTDEDASSTAANRFTLPGDLVLQPGDSSSIIYDAVSSRWRPNVHLMSVPVGSVVDFAGSTAPPGWLLCYGQAVSRTTYAALFAALSTTYGVGDGSTTFNVPDARGRVVAGKDNMGGSAANRITSGVSGITGTTLGAAGGDQRQQSLTVPVATTFAGVGNNAVRGEVTAPDTTIATSPNGGSSGNVQPTIIMNKIIYAGV